MRKFNYVAPTTMEEAQSILKEENAVLLAGGTDLVGVLKDRILPSSPDKVVNLKSIDGLKNIESKPDGLHIGALATLTEIATSPVVKEGWNALADAAYSVASPLIRNQATIGGNVCQDIRCWYYRYPHEIGGRIDCARKEGHLCSAMMGENQYHSIFGGVTVCETPCTTECPAKTDISAYLERLREDDIDGAVRILMEVNPMPAITGRVCAHFCMEGCNREKYDESVNVNAIERFLGDYVLDHYQEYMKAPETENGKHISIIGSGPAGLTTAYYLRQSGYAVTIYDRYEYAGGCLVYAIPSYRLPRDIMNKYISILEEMGIKFVLNTDVGKDITVKELVEKSDSVLLDNGTWGRPLIGLEGEELTEFGLDFLIQVNNYMLEKPGANVVVVGGGNVAMDVATTAKRLGCENVTMACLESREKMPANPEEVVLALEENIEILNGWGPTKVIKDGDKVTGVTFRKCTQSHDKDGNFAPLYDDNDTITIDADVVFMAVGQAPNTDFLDGSYTVEKNRGRILTQEDYRTNIDNLFAAGDNVTGPATVIGAIAGGKGAAIGINNFLQGPELVVETVEAARRAKEKEEKTFEEKCIHRKNAVHYSLLPAEERNMEKEDHTGISDHQATQEASRCFNCGCLAVNPSDVANMLVAYEAKIITTDREISAKDLFTVKTRIADVLHPGEIVKEFVIPHQPEGTIAAYNKYRVRKSIDFAVLAVGSVYQVKDGVITDAKISLGAVAPVPRRATKAEEFLIGKKATPEVAEQAAELALEGAIALENNQYKIDMTKVMVKRSLAF